MNQQPASKLTPLGRLLSIVLVAGLITAGVWMLRKDRSASPGSGAPASGAEGEAPAVAELQVEVPKLAAPAPFVLKDNIVPIEISEYAGYAGLIAANGGLDATESSTFFRNGGFKVKLTVSEGEGDSWSNLNQGKMAASVTTVDVLAAYGRQFHAVVPAQIGYSRGADGLVVRTEIKKVNDLKGRIVATSQFTEADFFIRYLAQEAGLEVHPLASYDAAPSPDRINLIYTEDGEQAGELFLSDLPAGKLAGVMTWEPTVSEVVQKSGGKARILITNRNLLVVGDILVVHRGFAEQNPKIVEGLVRGLLEGNRMVRDNRDAQLDTVARAFKWSRDKARDEIGKVHLANLPENLAFFSGAIDAAGSFGGIFQSAVLAYGPQLIRDPPDAERFLDLKALKAIEASGLFKDQKVAIAPIRSGSSASVETNPLLSKDIRFTFEPNSSDLDLESQANLSSLDAIKQLLQVSPGSTILLRGHVDNALVEEFRRKGGDAFVRTQALKAMELSRRRAGEIKRLLVERLKVDAQRIEVVGRGWEEPAGSNSDENRRVEVQWFTIE